MPARIYIAIPVHGRPHIAKECIPTVLTTRGDTDTAAIYDDGSTEIERNLIYCYRSQIWMALDIFQPTDPAIGIERQRRMHFMRFAEDADKAGWTHLYLTDADALHDPGWRQHALDMQQWAGGAPLCLYNTAAHERLAGNTIDDSPGNPVIWRRVMPGISYFMTREHVEKVVRWLTANPADHWHWDWTVPAILGNRCAVTRTSYCDHIGKGGMHDPVYEGYDGGDRATNPTEFLVRKRAEVVAALSNA